MNEMEFTEAESNANDLVSDYYLCWDSWGDDEEEGEFGECEDDGDYF